MVCKRSFMCLLPFFPGVADLQRELAHQDCRPERPEPRRSENTVRFSTASTVETMILVSSKGVTPHSLCRLIQIKRHERDKISAMSLNACDFRTFGEILSRSDVRDVPTSGWRSGRITRFTPRPRR